MLAKKTINNTITNQLFELGLSTGTVRKNTCMETEREMFRFLFVVFSLYRVLMGIHPHIEGFAESRWEEDVVCHN